MARTGLLVLLAVAAAVQARGQYTTDSERQAIQLYFQYRAASIPDCSQQNMLSANALNLATQCDNILFASETFPSTCPAICQQTVQAWGPTCASEYYRSAANDYSRWAALYDSGAYPSSSDIEFLAQTLKLADVVLNQEPLDWESVLAGSYPGASTADVATGLRTTASFSSDALRVCGEAAAAAATPAASASSPLSFMFTIAAAGGCWWLYLG
jgi:hypothetical protein